VTYIKIVLEVRVSVDKKRVLIKRKIDGQKNHPKIKIIKLQKKKKIYFN